MSTFGNLIQQNLFGNPEEESSLATGIPPWYDISFSSYLGVPFFHFMSNWDKDGPKINFTKRGGFGPAKVGDRVEAWYNAHLSPGEGTALVAKDFNGENYFGIEGYPTLVEKDYGGKKFKGLKFTGTEYLQINGASVADTYGVPGPMFSTGGSPWAGNTGATFIFVIDQDEVEPQPGCTQVPPGSRGGGICTSDVQVLLYSRQPVFDPSTVIPNNYTWPPTEDLGVQYFRNRFPIAPSHTTTRQSWGPDGVFVGVQWMGTSLDRPPIGGYGGAITLSPPTWDYGPGVTFHNAWTNKGLQVIIMEYDNTDPIKFIDAPNTTEGWDRNYEGPSCKLYATCPLGEPAWPNGDFTIPKLTGAYPALRDHILFDRKNVFLGGTPPITAWDSPFSDPDPFGNGFRGIIYEVIMLEGTLSRTDKDRLKKIFQRKYPI